MSGDQLVTTREQIKSTVFTPRMSGPSMSIEEYGDIVKAQAMVSSVWHMQIVCRQSLATITLYAKPKINTFDK